jgi:hypothetical protein
MEIPPTQRLQEEKKLVVFFLPSRYTGCTIKLVICATITGAQANNYELLGGECRCAKKQMSQRNKSPRACRRGKEVVAFGVWDQKFMGRRRHPQNDIIDENGIIGVLPM